MRSLSRKEAWQELAWAALDSVGEFGYAIDFFANVMSRLRLVVATIPEGGGEPQVSDDALANDTLDRLRSGKSSHSQLLHDLTVQLEVPGDCYLVGLAETETRMESWEVRSLDEVVKKQDRFHLVDRPDDRRNTIELNLDGDDNDYLARIWMPHPRFRELATSTSRRVLDTLELLTIMQRTYRAVFRQRLSRAKLLAIPNDFSDGQPDSTTGQPEEGESKQDPLDRDLHAHFVEPVGDEGHPASVSPFILRYPRSATFPEHGIVDLDLSPPIEEHLSEMETAALKRLAQGLNSPVEVIFGLGQANHWGGGEIKESTFREHIEPRAVVIMDALTNVFLRPMLLAAGASLEQVERYVVWFDSTHLVTNSDKPAVSAEAVRIGAIGHSAYRRVNSFDESDAPTDEEIDLMLRLTGKNPDAQRPAEARPESEGPGGEPPPVVMPDAARVASPAPPERTLDDLGRDLAALDRELLSTLMVGAHGAMTRALDRAGARVVTKARRDKALTQVLVGIPQRQVISLIGPAKLQALGLDHDSLLEGAFSEHVADFRSRCEIVADKAVGMVPGITPEAIEEARTAMSSFVMDASRWYEQALTETARKLMIDPSVTAPEQGEHVEGVLVPPDVVREARARAGGNLGGTTAALADRVAGFFRGLGVATGDYVTRLVSRFVAERRTRTYTWSYGVSPRQSFPPHLSLDGVKVKSAEDEKLTNGTGWPAVSYFYPGDHLGCLCDWVPGWE